MFSSSRTAGSLLTLGLPCTVTATRTCTVITSLIINCD